MDIIINRVVAKKYQADLFIDGELTYSYTDVRPGCAARQVINWIQNKYGTPDEGIKLTVEGW